MTYISCCSDFAFYFYYYFMENCHTWIIISKWQNDLHTNTSRSVWPILYGLMIKMLQYKMYPAGELAVLRQLLFYIIYTYSFVSSPEQRSGRAIVLPLASALASTNVKVFVKVFKTSLFPNLITDLIHLWYDDTYWSKILRSTIPTTLSHVKVKVTDLEFSC